MTRDDKANASARTDLGPVGTRAGVNVRQIQATRELFWHNVVREFLTGLSVLWAQQPDSSEETDPEDRIFDGRLAVITVLGARIPIGAVYPLFACSISDTAEDRALSLEVECTVFQVETPEGEAFTLPLHEIRAFHSLNSELMDRIKQAANSPDGQPPEDGGMPFGFAAFTSLARARSVPLTPPEVFVGPYFPPPG